MDLALTGLLRCPVCAGSLEAHAFESSDGLYETGVLVCGLCSRWYPVSEFVLDLLPPERAVAGSRAEFFELHRPRLEALGLELAAASRADIDPAFAAQERQREHFDDLALREDEFSYEAFGRQPFQIALRELTFGEWRPLLAPGSVVLDIGCADGISTFDIADPGITGLGFDISSASVLRAARRARSQNITNVSFFVGDADSIAVADEAVDCVLCYGTLHHVPDPARTIGEAARVLKRGGLYLGLENNTTPLRPIFDLLMRLRPLWREEAGAQALIGRAELRRWTERSHLELSGRPTVFVPPHLCNRLGVARARRLLARTDSVLRRLPGIRNWGGLIAIEGRKT
jgi:SAM-dependent methyltransferase/uncharacterized protein YbaR (Trm112 family)